MMVFGDFGGRGDELDVGEIKTDDWFTSAHVPSTYFTRHVCGVMLYIEHDLLSFDKPDYVSNFGFQVNGVSVGSNHCSPSTTLMD